MSRKTFQQMIQILIQKNHDELQKDSFFVRPTTGGNFDPQFPRNYHEIGHMAQDSYLENVFKFGFIYSMVANFHDKHYNLSTRDREEIRPLLEKLYFFYENSPILKKLSIEYQKKKIVQEKTGQIIIYLDTLNLQLTLYLNLIISLMHRNSFSIGYFQDQDALFSLFAVIKNQFYRSKHDIPSFLIELYPNLKPMKRKSDKDNMMYQVLLSIFTDIIVFDLSATPYFVQHYKFI